jgi:hypothetical protein
MRRIELSNHPAARLRRIEDRRTAELVAIQRQYEADLADHAALCGRLLSERGDARAKRRWLRWLGRSISLWLAEQEKPREPYIPYRTDDERERVTAGIQGEQQTADYFAGALNDVWVLLCGYKNQRGEIDQLLLGPAGLIAIEIKYRNATVGCRGDSWWFERFDRGGRLRQSGELVEGDGRSPSRQINEPADLLQEHLHRHGYSGLQIVRVVLLAHPRSQLGEISDLAVHLLATTPAAVLQHHINGRPPILSESHIRDIEGLIVKHHRSPGRRHARRPARESTSR